MFANWTVEKQSKMRKVNLVDERWLRVFCGKAVCIGICIYSHTYVILVAKCKVHLFD